MYVWRVLLGLAVVLVAFLLQVTVFARLPWPGVSPDLVLLVVLALALAYGSLTGAVTGFWAGMLVDLAPPSDTVVGRSALVLVVVGYLAGLMRREAEDSVLVSIGVVAAASVVATVGYALLAALMGDVRVTWDAVYRAVPPALVYDVLLSPFVVPAVMALARRAEPRAVRR